MEASTFTAGLERGRIAEFLFCLGDKYPGGLDWLDRRLDDIGAGRAQLFRVMAGADLAALAIETPKGHHYKKLSTFIVSPLYRRVGVGGRETNRACPICYSGSPAPSPITFQKCRWRRSASACEWLRDIEADGHADNQTEQREQVGQ
jgi:hypothetical protein